MTEPRVPYWLAQADRGDLAEAIADLIRRVDLHPRFRVHLDAVLTELGVVEARDHVWPMKTEIVRRATGYSSDVLPIRMSNEERQAVLTIPALPASVLAALTGGSEN